MTNKLLFNRSGMSPEVTCRKGRHAIESIVSRFSLASLICLCMLTVGSGNVWGGSPQEITPATSGWSATAGEQTGTVGDITVSTTRGVYNTQMRVYSGETFTVECSAGNMSKIVFTSSSGNFTTANVGSYATGTKTWTGTANSVTFSNSAQVRVTKVTVTYSASASVSAPTFGVAAGTYSNNQSVTLSCATAGATIYYTSSTNGVAPADPTSSSTAYSSAITVNHDNTIIKAIAIKGGTNSTVASATYRLTCATPTFSPTAGEYVGTQSVTISSETSNANIYYTTNGSTPTTSSTLYSGAITVSSSQTIKALVTKSNYTNSAVGSAAYTITPAHTVTWKNQGSTVTTTNVASGSKPVFPDMSSESGCQTYTYFYGWAEDTWSGEVTSPGTSSTVKVYKSASEMPNVTSDGVVYHAVWSDTEAGWAPAASISVGDVVLLVNASGTTYELGGISNTSTKYGLLHEYDTDPDETYPLTVGLGYNDENYSFKNGSDYLYWGSGNSLNVNSTLSTNTTWTVSIDANTKVATIRNVSDNTRYLQYNTGSRFACYANSCADPMLLKESASGNCVTSCCNQLAAPANPGETPNSTGAELTWDAVTGATGYEVKIDGGAWTSTGNGTTTGYTITGKACGGTNVSWQVRATGDGSTNCAAGAATSVRNFNTTACACTSQYTYFWGTSITNDNPAASAYASHLFECFNTWNGSEGKTGLITLPNSDTENYWFVGYNGYYYNSNLPGGGRSWCTAIADMNFANSQSDGKVLGWDGGYSYPRGATGYIRIYSDNTNSNKYAAFIPSGYILRWKNNRNSDAWTSYPFTDTGASNYWETDLVQLGANLSSDKVWVGLATSGMAEAYTWCGKSEEKNLIGVGKKTGASTWAANGIVAGDANQWGKWRIEVTNNATNWNVHFVPYWKATYDVNGGGAISPTTANEGPVSCEGDATVRQVTMPAAPTYAHHDFGGWKSSADNSINAAGATVSLTQNTTFTAQWTNSQYNITATLTNVTSETSFPVAYTYTGSAANVTYTFEASSGYRLPDNVTVTGSTYSWNKNSGELTLTGTITGAVSITISGTQTHTVTWSVNGATASSVTYDHGAALVLPTPDPSAPSGCSSKTFIGWTTHAEISSEVHDKPTLLNPASPGTVAGDVTYRAVFADEVTGKTTVTRYLYTTSISTGKNYIIASSNSAGSVNTATYPGSGNAFTNTSMTVVSGTPNYIAAPANNNAVWSVATGSASGKYYIQNVGTSGNYIRINGSAANISTDATDVYFDSDHGVFGKSGSGSTSYSFYYSSGWTKGTFSTSNRNYIFEATEVEVETTTTDNYITLCSTCTTPSNVTASSISSTGATISWEGVSIEQQPSGSGTGFVVKYGTNATRDLNSNTVNATSSESSKALTGLTPATQYYAWVQAKCDNSWSETPASFHTAAKITYDKNGGTGTNTSEDVTYNSNVTIKTIATLGFEAPSGKKFNGWVSDQAVTVSASSTTSVPDGATITSLTKAITLTAQWRDLASYTVNFSADNGTVAGGTSTTVYEDGTLTFPNVTSTTCGTFQGWVEAAYDNTAKPSGATFHEAGDVIDVTDALNDKTYYAVYAEVTDPTPTSDYVKVECEQTDWEGDYLIVSEYTISSTDYVKVFNGGLETLDASGNCVADVTITSKTITSNNTTDGYKFTISAVAGQAGKFYIKSVGYSKYIGNSGTGNALSSSTEASSTYYNTIEYDATNSRVLIKGNNASPTRLAYNSATGASNNRFRYYSAPDSQKDIQLYKKGGAETVNYNTSPSCSPTVALTCSFSTFTYVYNAGPSASQTFMVSGSNLGANTMTVTAPTNYEVSKDNSTFSSSVSYTPSDGSVAASTVYIRLAAGLSVGTYNYAQASGLVVACAGAGATAQKAALNGSVTKATGSIAFTDFNAGDHYEAEWTGSAILVPYNYILTGDGTLTTTKVDGRGGTVDTENKKWSLTNEGTYQLRLTLGNGTNYTGAGPVTADFVIYKADRFYDNLHGNDVIVKRNDTGEDHYTIPSLTDESRLTSGSCSETHYHFMGWVPESALNTLTDDASYTAVMITGGTQAASGTNYYAVWAEE